MRSIVVKIRATHRRKAISFPGKRQLQESQEQMPQVRILLKALPAVTNL
jgi:hypothetical protein